MTSFKEKIQYILTELKQDNRRAYIILKEADKRIKTLEEENKRLKAIEIAFNTFKG